MSVGVESRRSNSIKFALVQKGKSVIVKASYDSAGDMLLAQRAWQQMQVAAGGIACGDESAVDEFRKCAAEAAHAQASSIVDGDSVSSDNMAIALKCIKSPEWHKNGATLRLPDGHPNAMQILTQLARDFESCVQKQLKRAEEDDAVASFAATTSSRYVTGCGAASSSTARACVQFRPPPARADSLVRLVQRSRRYGQEEDCSPHAASGPACGRHVEADWRCPVLRRAALRPRNHAADCRIEVAAHGATPQAPRTRGTMVQMGQSFSSKGLARRRHTHGQYAAR